MNWILMPEKCHKVCSNVNYQLALDKVSMDLAANSGSNVLRVYRFEKPAVVLAKAEHIEDVNLAYCKEKGIEVARRESGGSVIHLYPGTLGVCISGTDPHGPNVQKTHEIWGYMLAELLQELGMPNVELGEHFSIRSNGGVVCGFGQDWNGGVYTYHGIIAVERWDADEIERMIKLREMDGKKEKEIIRSYPAVRDYSKISTEELRDMIVNKYTSGNFTEVSPTKIAKRVHKEAQKYSDDDWLFTANGRHLKRGLGFCFVDMLEPENAFKSLPRTSANQGPLYIS